MSALILNSWRYDENDQSFTHCNRRAYWGYDEATGYSAVYCSKCQDEMPAVCDSCGELTDREQFEPYCYKCDESFDDR